MTGLRHRLGQLRPRRAWSDFPVLGELERARFAQDMATAPPRHPYVMLFTPRSGSSWVADLLTRTRRMGRVIEAFNPNFLPKLTRAMNAATLDEYCAVLPRRMQCDGVFGFQITAYQMRTVFGRDRTFLEHYHAQPFVWLLREDIVGQAISLYKMERAQITHAPALRARPAGAAEAGLDYNRARIHHWLKHVRRMEIETEALIARAGLAPLRMSYERNIALKSNHIANVIGRHVGRGTMKMKPLSSPHARIATPLSRAFTERFETEERSYLAELAEARAPLLAQHVRYGPKGSLPADPGLA